MRLDLLETERPSETRETVSFPPEEEAVRIQDEIFRLKLRIEELEAQRDEAIAQALANGVKFYGGYRFGKKTPVSTLSEKKIQPTLSPVCEAEKASTAANSVMIFFFKRSVVPNIREPLTSTISIIVNSRSSS